MRLALERIPLNLIKEAHERIKQDILRTPLLKLNTSDAANQIYLKCENLQPIGSFKLRGAGNAMKMTDPVLLEDGVWTASAGNMAQGVGWYARKLSIKSTIVVPDHAPSAKLEAIAKLGSEILKVPFEEWIEILKTHHKDGMEGLFIHPFANPNVMAGNGTIGLEIIEDLPDVDIIIIPYGGGGLSCGIASAIRQLKPDTQIFASEVSTAAPLKASLEAKKPIDIQYTPSFVDGIGAPNIFEEIWPLVNQLLDDSKVVTLQEVVDVLRALILENNIIAEGAGASSVAAALNLPDEGKKIICVVSGGNIDTHKIVKILNGITL